MIDEKKRFDLRMQCLHLAVDVCKFDITPNQVVQRAGEYWDWLHRDIGYVEPAKAALNPDDDIPF